MENDIVTDEDREVLAIETIIFWCNKLIEANKTKNKELKEHINWRLTKEFYNYNKYDSVKEVIKFIKEYDVR